MQWLPYRTTAEAVSHRYLATSLLATWATMFVIVSALILSFATVLFAEEAKPKDSWDKADILAKIVLGFAGAAISTALGVAVYFYNKRQGKNAILREKHELTLRQIETIHKFIPELISKDQEINWRSLVLIHILEDDELAIKVGTWYIDRLLTQEDRETVEKLKNDPDPFIAELATRAYNNYYAMIQKRVTLSAKHPRLSNSVSSTGNCCPRFKSLFQKALSLLSAEKSVTLLLGMVEPCHYYSTILHN
jgi:hypothetical protein